MRNAADLVQAESVLVAGLAVVYGLWYPALVAARDRKLPSHAADAAAPKGEIRALYKARGIPLAVGAAITTAAFLPPSVDVCVDTGKLIGEQGLGAVGDYDPVSASVVLITLTCALLAAHVGRLAESLRRKSR
jgi:hypothetical protein